jgi:hypothetical protein
MFSYIPAARIRKKCTAEAGGTRAAGQDNGGEPNLRAGGRASVQEATPRIRVLLNGGMIVKEDLKTCFPYLVPRSVNPSAAAASLRPVPRHSFFFTCSENKSGQKLWGLPTPPFPTPMARTPLSLSALLWPRNPPCALWLGFLPFFPLHCCVHGPSATAKAAAAETLSFSLSRARGDQKRARSFWWDPHAARRL